MAAAAAATDDTRRALPRPGGDVPVAHRIPSPGAASSKTPRPAPGRGRPGRPTTVPQGDEESGGLPAPAAGGAGAPLGPSPVAAMGAKTAAALGAAGTATAGAAKALGGRFGDWSAQAKERTKAAADEREKRRAEAAAQREETERNRSEARAAAGLDEDTGAPRRTLVPSSEEDRLEPPAPLLPPSAAEPLTRDQSRMAIGIILGFIVVALGLAMWGLSKVPSLPGLPDLNETSAVTPPATTDPDAEGGATDGSGETDDAPAGPDAAMTPGQPLTFTDVVDYDPLGDVEERPEQLPNILDEDPSTFWNSMGYQSTTFSGLKEGMGVILDLGESSSLSEVTLDLPLANTGQIYVTDDEAYFTERPSIADDLEPAGEFTGPGSISVELAEGTSGRYVIVWFTNSVPVGEWHRAQLAGATATS